MKLATDLARMGTWLRIVAALVGTLPAALLASISLARFLPFSESTRFALGFAAVVPFWVALMCLTFLARSSARAWAALASVSAVLAALVYLVPR